jgi:predicted DNA-binding transcriptional regulator AlpA
LRINDAAATLGIGRTMIYSLINDQLLPSPLKLYDDARASLIPSAELNSVIAARAAGKSDAEVRTLVQSLNASRRQAA